MKKEILKFTEVRQLLKGRRIHVRCNDIRFVVSRASFEHSCYMLLPKSALRFTVEYNEGKIFIESVSQINN